MIAMRAQAIDTVAELFEDNPRVAVVLAEISVDRFQPVFAHDPARAVNVGIMEQTMVGVAAGYALEGFHPVIHTITPFVAERALEQLKLDFGNQELGVLVIGVGLAVLFWGGIFWLGRPGRDADRIDASALDPTSALATSA